MIFKYFKYGLYAGIILYWFYTLNHYYFIIRLYAEQNIYITNPILYCAVESWLLFGAAVLTYIIITILKDSI